MKKTLVLGANSFSGQDFVDLLLGDPSRLKIVVACLKKPLAVSDIADKLGLSVSLVSHHLRLLKGARLVRSERQGKQVFYGADDEHVRRMVEDMVIHVGEQA